MLTYRKILVPTDFSSYSLQALPYARALAAAHGATVALVHAVRRRGDLETATRRLEDLATRLESIPHEIRVERGSPPSVVNRLAEEMGADLIVLSTRGRRGVARRVMGSTAEAVVAGAPCPVLTVKQPEHEFVVLEVPPPAPPPPLPKTLTLRARPPTEEDLYFAEQDRQRLLEQWAARVPKPHLAIHLRRILVPTDLSEPSRQALRYAAELARAYGSSLTLLHCLDNLGLLVAEPSLSADPEALRRDLLGAAVERLSVLGRELEGVDWQGQVDFGSPARSIVKVARDREIDLIVMATQGPQGLADMVLGSTAQAVVRRAPCPVLTLRAAVPTPAEERPLVGTAAGPAS
jgi:nucleotide-binding universal stress UspA family protein